MSRYGFEERKALMEIVAAQYGVFSRAQARSLGLSNRMIDYRLAEGIWERFLPSVVRVPGHSACWRQSVIGASLWGGTDAVVSHRSAAAWWGLEGIPEIPVDLTLDSNRHSPAKWLVLHRTKAVPEIVRSGTVNVTSIRRTLLDLAAVLHERAVGRALDEAVRRDLVSMAELHEVVDGVYGPGLRGARLLRRLIQERVSKAAPTESRLEAEALAVLRRGGLPEPCCQYEVRENGRVLARIDFAYPDHRIALECDGLAYHFGKEAWQRDRTRLNELVLRGWRVIRVTWRDVRDRPSWVIQQMEALLAGAAFRSQQR